MTTERSTFFVLPIVALTLRDSRCLAPARAARSGRARVSARAAPLARRAAAAGAPRASAQGQGRARRRRQEGLPDHRGDPNRGQDPEARGLLLLSEVEHQLRLAGVEAGLHPQDSGQRFALPVLSRSHTEGTDEWRPRQRLDKRSSAERLPSSKILRIGIIQGGRIVEERLVRKRENITIGQSAKNMFVVPSDALPRNWLLFEAERQPATSRTSPTGWTRASRSATRSSRCRS